MMKKNVAKENFFTTKCGFMIVFQSHITGYLDFSNKIFFFKYCTSKPKKY